MTTNKPIIHIAPDEKFIDAAFEIYDLAFPGKNQFYIFKDSRKDKVSHVSREKNYKFFFLEDNYIKELTPILKKAVYVVFHSMYPCQAAIALKVEIPGKLAWTSFGFEIYNNPGVTKLRRYGPRTQKTFIGLSSRVKQFFKPVYHLVFRGQEVDYLQKLKAIKKCDYAIVTYKEDYDLFVRLNLLGINTKWIPFTYYPIGVIIDRQSPFVTESNILLGNSASYTNNHLEAFDYLKTLPLKNQKIITPLSYGDKQYANAIADIGSNYFGDNFEALTMFLPLREYQALTQSCGIVIMNHYRQQGVGNVLDMMYRGAKVYLSERSTLFHYLKRIGCHICSIERDLNNNNKQALSLLTKEQMLHNRSTLNKELNLNKVVSQLQEAIKPNSLENHLCP